MTPRTIKTLMLVGGFLGGGVLLGILGFAMQFWISINVAAQIDDIIIPDTGQLTTDVATLTLSVEHIEGDIATALASQQRFEELFIEYLQREAQ